MRWFFDGGTMRIFPALGMAFCLIAMNVPAGAQWVDYPDPRTPRTAEGKPTLTAPAPRKIIHRPGQFVLCVEPYHDYRLMYADGRRLPEEREPAWFGYSVGKWDGDTLVVDTVGLKEETWLDFARHPHSDALHIIERFRRTDFGHMEVQVTVDDPKAYIKPWTPRIEWEMIPDTDLLDWVCENERDFLRLSGK